jgi:aerobic carbon-monoxide dehydrogenase medium subunit
MVATFAYRAAATVDEAIDLLKEHGEDAKLLAGGQSLVPLINLGLAQPTFVIDLNQISTLDYLEERDGYLAVGALTRHATTEQSELVRRLCPLLAEAMPLIGDRQVRNRGTLGGSIAHADPLAELPTVAACLGATMKAISPRGEREISAADFFVSYLTNSLAPDELLIEVQFPSSRPRTGVAFEELVRRKGDFAIVAAAASVTLGEDGACQDVRLALAGVSDHPVQVETVTALLVGKQPTAEAIAEAAEAACRGLDPESDVMASAEYRLAMAEVYARRALTLAMERARG